MARDQQDKIPAAEYSRIKILGGTPDAGEDLLSKLFGLAHRPGLLLRDSPDQIAVGLHALVDRVDLSVCNSMKHLGLDSFRLKVDRCAIRRIEMPVASCYLRHIIASYNPYAAIATSDLTDTPYRDCR